RACTSGWCSTRSSAHASAVAVVSWPATRSVISSSRSSSSVSGRPSSSRASSNKDSTSSWPAVPAARRRAACAMSAASTSPLARPRAYLLMRDVTHELLVASHPLTVERGHDQLALAQMLSSVEHEERVLSEDRLKRRVGVARTQIVGARREDGAYSFGVRDEH